MCAHPDADGCRDSGEAKNDAIRVPRSEFRGSGLGFRRQGSRLKT